MSAFPSVTWTCPRCQKTVPAWIILRTAPICGCGKPMAASEADLRQQRLHSRKWLEAQGRGWRRLRFG